MKTILFANGTSIEYAQRIEDSDYIQGAERSVLEFRFDPSKVTLDQIDGLFSDLGCERMHITETQTVQVPVFEDQPVDVPVLDDEGNETGETNTETQSVQVGTKDETYTDEFIYDGYCVRCILSRQLFPTHTDKGLVDKEFISIRMAQRTYAEAKIAALAEENTNTQLALVEVYEMLLA